jgi:hypothetical protein
LGLSGSYELTACSATAGPTNLESSFVVGTAPWKLRFVELEEGRIVERDSVSTSGIPPGLIFAADFNLDGKLDCLSKARLTTEADLYVSNATGGHSPSGEISVDGSGIVLGDFDKNGTTDIATVNGLTSPSITLYRNDGKGAFTPEVVDLPFPVKVLCSSTDANGRGTSILGFEVVKGLRGVLPNHLGRGVSIGFEK